MARRVIAAREALSAEADAGLSRLRVTGSISKFGCGQRLFGESEPADNCYSVVSGAVRTTRLMPDGRRQVINFVTPGEYFGFTKSATHSCTAEAMTDTAVAAYSRASVEALLDGGRGFGRQLLILFWRELLAAQQHLLLLGRKTAKERVASFLVILMERRAGHLAAEPPQFDLFMSRTDIADYLGLTIETVSRALTQLRCQQLIALTSATRVVVLQPTALKRLSEGLPG